MQVTRGWGVFQAGILNLTSRMVCFWTFKFARQFKPYQENSVLSWQLCYLTAVCIELVSQRADFE